MVWLWVKLLSMPLVIRVLLLVLTVGLWTYLCLAPSDNIGPPLINDKVAHFIGNFGVVGVVFIAGLMRHYLNLFGLVFVYSVAIECVQGLLPDRSFSVLDMLANAAGILVAVLLIRYLQHRRLDNVVWL